MELITNHISSSNLFSASSLMMFNFIVVFIFNRDESYLAAPEGCVTIRHHVEVNSRNPSVSLVIYFTKVLLIKSIFV